MTLTPQFASSRSRCWKWASPPLGCCLQEELFQGNSHGAGGTAWSWARSCLFNLPNQWVTWGQGLRASGGIHLPLVVRAPHHVLWEFNWSLGAVGAPTRTVMPPGWAPVPWYSGGTAISQAESGLPFLWLGFWCLNSPLQVCSFHASSDSHQVPYKHHPQA